MKKLFFALLGGAVVYELVTLSNKHEGDTISEIVWDATTRRPLVPFAAGLLCGHFFWQRAADRTAPSSPSLLQPPPPFAATGAGVDAAIASL